jgi:hypothetical protein
VTPATAAAVSGPSGVAAKGAHLCDMDTAEKLWDVATTTKRPIGGIAGIKVGAKTTMLRLTSLPPGQATD